MASEVEIKEARMIATLAPKSGAYGKRGDLIGYNSGWVLADSDVSTIYYAQWIALEDFVGDGTKTIKVAKEAIVYDADAAYTANTIQYLSGTAGATTETRPTRGLGNLVQVVGQSLDTYTCYLKIGPVREFEMFLPPDVYDTTGEPGLGVLDTGWVGPGIDAATEDVYFKGRVPENVVSTVLVARVILNSVNASAADIDFSIVGAYDSTDGYGAANNQDTGTAITATDWDQTDADNKILTVDVSTLFDTGFWLPGRTFCVRCAPDSITGEAQVIGLQIVGLCVD